MKIELPEELKIYNVQEFWTEFTAKLKDRKAEEELTVTADKLTEIDGAGLQLLIVIERELSQKKAGFRFKQFPASLKQTIESYGFTINR